MTTARAPLPLSAIRIHLTPRTPDAAPVVIEGDDLLRLLQLAVAAPSVSALCVGGEELSHLLRGVGDVVLAVSRDPDTGLSENGAWAISHLLDRLAYSAGLDRDARFTVTIGDEVAS